MTVEQFSAEQEINTGVEQTTVEQFSAEQEINTGV
jgi:hypothetical protein